MLDVRTEWNQPCRNSAGVATLYLGVRIKPVSSASGIPIHVLVLLDVSGSMEGAKFRNACAALEEVWRKLRPGDRLAVVTFSGEVRSVLPWAEKGQTADSAIHAVADACKVGGVTRLEAGLHAAVRRLLECPGSDPRFLWVVTDGDPTTSSGTPVVERGPYLEIAQSAAQQGLVVGALGLGPATDYKAEFLIALADRGQGKFCYAPDPAGLSAQLDTLLEAARAVSATQGRVEITFNPGSTVIGVARVFPEIVLMDAPPVQGPWSIPVGVLSVPETVIMLEVATGAPYGVTPGVHPLGELWVTAEEAGVPVQSAKVPIELEFARPGSRKIVSRNREMENLHYGWEMSRHELARCATDDPMEQLRLTGQMLDHSLAMDDQARSAALAADADRLKKSRPLSKDRLAQSTLDIRASGRWLKKAGEPDQH